MLLKLEFLTVQVLEEMTVKDEEKALLKNIRYKNQLDEQKEPVVRAIYELQQSVTRSLHFLE